MQFAIDSIVLSSFIQKCWYSENTVLKAFRLWPSFIPRDIKNLRADPTLREILHVATQTDTELKISVARIQFMFSRNSAWRFILRIKAIANSPRCSKLVWKVKRWQPKVSLLELRPVCSDSLWQRAHSKSFKVSELESGIRRTISQMSHLKHAFEDCFLQNCSTFEFSIFSLKSA